MTKAMTFHEALAKRRAAKPAEGSITPTSDGLKVLDRILDKMKAKATDGTENATANQKAFARAIAAEVGISYEEALRRVVHGGKARKSETSDDASDLAKSAFDGARAAGMSDDEAGRSATLAILKNRPEPSMEDVEDRVERSRGGWNDFQKEADLLAKQYGLPATEAFTLARKTFEPRV